MTTRRRISAILAAGVAFALAAGLSPQPAGTGLSYPAIASAAGSCSLAALVCANDSAPGCEIICGGEEQAVCVEGSCSASGNIVTPNKCSCKSP